MKPSQSLAEQPCPAPQPPGRGQHASASTTTPSLAPSFLPRPLLGSKAESSPSATVPSSLAHGGDGSPVSLSWVPGGFPRSNPIGTNRLQKFPLLFNRNPQPLSNNSVYFRCLLNFNHRLQSPSLLILLTITMEIAFGTSNANLKFLSPNHGSDWIGEQKKERKNT